MNSSEQAQKDVDILIDLIGKSPMSARKKELALDKIKSICEYVTIVENETNKVAKRKFGFETDEQLLNYFDRLKAFAEILGVGDIDLLLLNPKVYQFIKSNYGYIKQPINNISFQQLCYALKIYNTFTGEYPVSMYNLKVWLKENEYGEIITKLNEDVLKKLESINETI